MDLNLGILVLELVKRLKPGTECCRTVSSVQLKDHSGRQKAAPLLRPTSI